MIESTGEGSRSCLLTQHHAIYGGYSLDLLFQEVTKAYTLVHDNSPVAPFQAFMKHVSDLDKEKTREFWCREFLESEAVPFPALPRHEYQPKADSTVLRAIHHLDFGHRDITASTIIRTAWSILSAHYTNSNDVVFGAVVTGRQASIVGIERMIAPLIAALPVQIKLEQGERVDDLLNKVQKQSIDMIAYEQTEALEIRRINADTERGGHFNTLLAIQPAGQGILMNHSDSPFEHRLELKSSANGLNTFNPHAVMILCQLKDNNDLGLEISFDSNVIDQAQMERLSVQFEQVLRQICTKGIKRIEETGLISAQEIDQISKSKQS